MYKMIKRKIRSGIKKISASVVSFMVKSKIYLLEENITLGSNVVIGGGVVIKTTDGGKIIIEDNVSIERYCYIYAQQGTIKIGKESFIGMGSQIVAKKSIIIGKDSLVSANCVIRDANHRTKRDTFINKQGHIVESIDIEDDVWLGSHVVVTAGNRVGKGAVVGANAVVTKDVDPYTVVGGVPAKFIQDRA